MPPSTRPPRRDPAIPEGVGSRRLSVLAWTDHFFGPDYLEPKRVDDESGVTIELEFTSDRDRLSRADAVWFHGPSITDLPRRKEQPWVLMSMESDVNYPALSNPYATRAFDLHMTYRLDSDVPCVYPNWPQYGTFLETPRRRRGPSTGALAVYIASNPVEYRDRFARELMHYVPVDGLGNCLRNAEIDGFVTGLGVWDRGGWSSVLSVLPRYKFYLAFENSRTTDYVTERVFHALVCGVVPIYLGAPNVRDFMPADDALIVASDFSSAHELAEYMRYLDENDTAYEKHLHWKTDGYSKDFERLVDLGSVEPQLRMAVKLAHGCDRRCDCGGRMRPSEPAP